MTAGTAAQLSSALEFAPLPTAVSCARLHAVHVLHEWGLRRLAEDAALIVSDSLNLLFCSLGPFCCFSGCGLRGFRGRLWCLCGGGSGLACLLLLRG